MTPACSSARRRRREGEGERCRRSASAALEIRPSVWRMVSICLSRWSKGIFVPRGSGLAQIVAQLGTRRAQFGTICPPICARMPDMLSTRTGTAMYVGAVLGPGVLFLPSLAARVAGPASVLAWGALLALSVPLAATFAALGVRFPEAGGTAAYARAAFGGRAAAATGWWFLCGVV